MVSCYTQENEIGLDHALYYIAYATYLEFRGNYAKADAVYQQGINRLAAPVDRLKAKFAEFQQRMVWISYHSNLCEERLRGWGCSPSCVAWGEVNANTVHSVYSVMPSCITYYSSFTS